MYTMSMADRFPGHYGFGINEWRVFVLGVVFVDFAGYFFRFKFRSGVREPERVGNLGGDELWDVDSDGEIFVVRKNGGRMTIVHLESEGRERPVLTCSAFMDFRVASRDTFYILVGEELSFIAIERGQLMQKKLGVYWCEEYTRRDVLVGPKGEVSIAYDHTLCLVERTRQYDEEKVSGPTDLISTFSGPLESQKGVPFTVLGRTETTIGTFPSDQHAFHVSGRLYYQEGQSLFTVGTGSTPQLICSGNVKEFKVCHALTGVVVVKEVDRRRLEGMQKAEDRGRFQLWLPQRV